MHAEDLDAAASRLFFSFHFISGEIRTAGKTKQKNRHVLQMLQDDEISVKGSVNSVFVRVCACVRACCLSLSLSRTGRLLYVSDCKQPTAGAFCLRRLQPAYGS